MDKPDNCSKCGFCLDACPVYRELLIEPVSPRGKIQLSKQILEGQLDFSKNMKEILSKCLLCGSCSAACPGGVQGAQLFSGMRWMGMEKLGLDWHKKILYQVLAKKWMMSASAGFAAWADHHFGQFIRKTPSLPGLIKGVPPFNQRPFAKTVKEITPAAGKHRARIFYFHGCATNFLSEEIGHAVIRVLTRMGVEVVTPKDQVCCGIPIVVSGARQLALENIRNTVNTFSHKNTDTVIVDCATCGSALRKEYLPILKELQKQGQTVSDDLIHAAQNLSENTRDIMEYISDHLDWLPEPEKGKDRISFTYHDPCHLKKGQGVGLKVRKVFDRMPGTEFIEMEQPDACCGGGGIFQVDHPELSQAITKRKVKHIYQTGAKVLATGCPGCRMTIEANLDNAHPVRVFHPIQLLDRAFEK